MFSGIDEKGKSVYCHHLQIISLLLIISLDSMNLVYDRISESWNPTQCQM